MHLNHCLHKLWKKLIIVELLFKCMLTIIIISRNVFFVISEVYAKQDSKGFFINYLLKKAQNLNLNKATK